MKEYYSQSFDELNGIAEGVVRYSRVHISHIPSETHRAQILAHISRLGEHGSKTEEFLESAKDCFQSLYGRGRWRHRLIRHVIALFLFNRVFEPFALGISQEFSDGLRAIDMNVNTLGVAFLYMKVDDAEPKFSNILLIHQAIGRGIVHLAREKVAIRQVELTGELAELLRLLLPLTSEDSIALLAKRIVAKAVLLKTAMIEEHTLFQCFMADCGDNFNERFLEVDNERPAGRVLLCTFPGLARTIKKDNQRIEIIVVKARASMNTET